jgi:hypothetical protein
MVDMRINIESEKLVRGMKTFARETGQTLKDVYSDQMRLASNSLAKNFPPKSSAKFKRGIVEKELPNIFTEAPSDFILDSWVTVGTPPERIFKTKTGAIIGVDKSHYNPDGNIAMMEQHHQANRNASNGRVTRAGSFTRDIGRWKFINRQIVPKGAIARYARARVFPKLGTMKAGWILPSSSGLTTKADSWVKRAYGNARGASEYTDQMNLFAVGFLRLVNMIPYAARQSGLVRIELQKRQRDLLRKSGRAMGKEIAKFNRGKV